MGWDILSWGLPAALALLLVWAGIEDVRTREIANWKNAAIALMAPLWWLSLGLAPWPDMALQMGLALLVFAVFCVAFHFGQMGGGDVKLIGALSLWLPLAPLVTMLVVMSVVGGAVTLIFLVEHKIKRKPGVVEIPYGVAIAVAGLISLREPLLNHFT